MNVYRVYNIDTYEEFTGTTEEVTEKLYISVDNLNWHCKKKTPFAGWQIEKIGNDGLGNHRGVRKVEKAKKKSEGTLEDDIRMANACGMTYGKWKLLQTK